MNEKAKFFIALIIFFIIIIVISIFMKIYSIWSLIGMIFYTILFFALYLYILYEGRRLEIERHNRDEKKQTFKWCWNKVNDILRKMPGGEGLEWGGGFGKRSEVKYFSDGKIQHPFRYIFGNLSESKQPVLIILDVDKEDIGRYYANPTPSLLDNPFDSFRPFSGQERDNFGYRDWRFGYDRRSRYRPEYRDSGISELGPGREAEYSQFPISPPNNQINNAVDKLRERNDKNRERK